MFSPISLCNLSMLVRRSMKPIVNPYAATCGETAASVDTEASTSTSNLVDSANGGLTSQSQSQCSTIEEVNDAAKGLHVQVHRGYQAHRSQYWWDTIVSNARWFRVKYKSGRFGKQCETPCWTTFYGGRTEYQPYEPVPDWLQPLVDEVSRDLNMPMPFNAMLLRLYFDGNDEIAWHTDGRTFLGNAPTIASLSFGANATFEMRRMHNVWPPLDGSAGDCVDRTTLQRNFVVGDGDMLVMMGATQKHWHHRVPKEKGRMPRLNINFRMILGGPDAERGQQTYYKYMVHGDEELPKSLRYEEIMKMKGGMMNFTSAVGKPKIECESAIESSSTKNDAVVDNSASKNALSDNVASYLAAEKVDEATFMLLPDEIRRELVSDWTSRRMVASASRLLTTGLKRHYENSNSIVKNKSGCTGKKTKGNGSGRGGEPAGKKKRAGTLDVFFKQR